MTIPAGILRRPLASLSLLASALIFVAVALAGDAQAQREPQAVSPQSQKQIQRERTGAQAQTQAQRRELGPGAGRESGRAGQGVSRSAEFRTALAPHGRWERHGRFGDVWVPSSRSREWRPYTVGRWVYTDDWGWYWVEDRDEADWGWVTYHYGRWIEDRDLGWAWIPGEEWGPGFVQWRHSSDQVGWSPLPPAEIIVEYRDRPDAWVFVRTRDFVVAPRLVQVLLPRTQYAVYIRQTIVVNQTVLMNDRPGIAVNPGIPAALIAANIGRPIRTFDVQPRVFPGTTQVRGAVAVRTQDLGNRNVRPVTVRETRNTIQPDRTRQLQPLARGERGRLGDTPPRAAVGDGVQQRPGRDARQAEPKKQAEQKNQQGKNDTRLQKEGQRQQGSQETREPRQASPVQGRNADQNRQQQGRLQREQQQRDAVSSRTGGSSEQRQPRQSEPRRQERDRQSVGAQREQAPQRAQREQAPQRAQREQPPQRAQREQAPQRAQREQAPQRAQREQAPQRAQREQAPQRAQREQPPQRTQAPRQEPSTQGRGSISNQAAPRDRQPAGVTEGRGNRGSSGGQIGGQGGRQGQPQGQPNVRGPGGGERRGGDR